LPLAKRSSCLCAARCTAPEQKSWDVCCQDLRRPANRISCVCGHSAHYHDTRPKQLLTALGPVRFERGYYICPQCRRGQSPRDRELDVEGTECSPGVRRMLAVVGAEASFDKGRDQLALLAGLEVTAKAVERHAEAMGADIAAREDEEIRRAKQLELPEVCAPAVPVCYIELDGTGVPVVKAETVGRAAKSRASRLIPAKSNSAAYLPKPPPTPRAGPSAMRTPPPTPPRSRPPRSSVYASTPRLADAVGAGPGRKRSSPMGRCGSGTSADQHFPGAVQIVDLYHARQHLWETLRQAVPQRRTGS